MTEHIHYVVCPHCCYRHSLDQFEEFAAMVREIKCTNCGLKFLAWAEHRTIYITKRPEGSMNR